MKYIDRRSVELLLKESIKGEEKYLNSSNPDHAQQARENIEAWQKCLDSKRANELIVEWNKLLCAAMNIQQEAARMHPIFARYFRLD